MTRQTLEQKIIILIFALLSGTVVIYSAIHLSGFIDDYRRSLVVQTRNAVHALQKDVGKVLALGIELYDMQGLVEKCRETLEHNPFLCHCFITDPNGKVLTSDAPLHPEVADDAAKGDLVTVAGHRVVLTTTPALGAVYDLALPLSAPDGKIAGYVHAGFGRHLITSKVMTIALYTAFILLGALLASLFLSIRFVRRMITAPITRLIEGVQRVAKGEYHIHLPEGTGTYDLDELARNVNLMASALEERQLQLQSSYEELAATHEKLQISYLQLEGLSLEVERSSELYRSLMQESTDAIVVFDEQGTVKMANRSAGELFGVDPLRLRGMSVDEFITTVSFEKGDDVRALFAHVAAGGSLSGEASFASENGERRVVRLTLSSVLTGEQTVMQAIFHDLTREYEMMENLRRSADDLARLNRMKESFIGMASHELKTPLTVILGYTELLMNEMEEGGDEQTREMIRNVASAAQRLDGIVRDIVDVSLMSGKRIVVRREPVDVNALIESTVGEMRYFFRIRNQEITLNLEPGLPEIVGDAGRLSQLLTNVIGNAVKFTPDGGRITVSTLSKYLDRSAGISSPAEELLTGERVAQPRLYVEIVVQDTGLGIDKKEQALIFEKFYEGGEISEHSTGKSSFRGKGTGLGLYIAKRVVELHGGEIWVESPGYDPATFPGSTFHILIPVDPPPVSEEESAF